MHAEFTTAGITIWWLYMYNLLIFPSFFAIWLQSAHSFYSNNALTRQEQMACDNVTCAECAREHTVQQTTEEAAKAAALPSPAHTCHSLEQNAQPGGQLHRRLRA